MIMREVGIEQSATSGRLRDAFWIALLVIAASAFVVVSSETGLVFAVYWVLQWFVTFREFYDALPAIFWVISAIAALAAGFIASIRIRGSTRRAVLWTALFCLLQFGLVVCVAVPFVQAEWLAYGLGGWLVGVPAAFFCGTMVGKRSFNRAEAT